MTRHFDPFAGCDPVTGELLRRPDGTGGGLPDRRDDPVAKPNRFDYSHSVLDEKSSVQRPPKVANLCITGGRFVPVSFVARDWGVTPRRIRALLADGRLLGRVLDNGFWEVKFPYSFTFGTRGPSLKRQQRREKRPKKPELKVVGK
ncbi:MAG: hypothetical protein PHH47_10250 [Gallionella sp.]|nr:hypothetical protein [Gallionella sp.]MDD4946482.1 hypothetical protein [Gallionella sp.]